MIFHVGNRFAAEETVVHVSGASNTIEVVNVLYRGAAGLRKWDKGGVGVDVIGFTIDLEFDRIELFERYGVLVMGMTWDIVGYKTPPAFLADEGTECLVEEESEGVKDGRSEKVVHCPMKNDAI